MALLEGDGIHVAGLGAQGWTETVIPSTLPLRPSCAPPSVGCPAMPCHETGAGVSPGVDGQGESASVGLAWTVDGAAWLAYAIVRNDEQVHFVLTNNEIDECLATIDSGGPSWEVHVARVPLDGTTIKEILRLPVPPIEGFPAGYIANQAQAKTARFFDLKVFGTDLALGFRTRDASGAGTVRVLRIDTTIVAGAQ